MTKREQLIALVEERAGLQRRLTEIDAEIDELFGEGTTRPGRRPKQPKEVTQAQPREPAAGGSRPSPSATNGAGSGRGNYPHKVDPIRDKIVALAKDGLSRNEIAAKLGFKDRAGQVKVSNHLYRARQAGDLPKAVASQ